MAETATTARRPSAAADTRPPLTCYIRTLNEERRIAEVVAAASRVAREVIVVDSGSTDRTVALAREAGAVVHDQPWLGNGKQKRVGEDLAVNDWLLDLDADEVVTPALADEIAALFAGGEPAMKAYRVPMVYAPPFGAPWWGFRHANRAKLYDRRAFRAPDHTAWDQFPIPRGAAIGQLANPIVHHGIADIEHLMAKLNRVSTVRAHETPMKSRPYLALRVFFGLPVYFAKRYVFTGFWRGGVYGFAISLAFAYGRWLRDVKMYEIQRRADEAPDDTSGR